MSLFDRSEHTRQMDDQRSTNRKRTSKAASILFGRQTGEHSCDVEVTDLGNGGAGIYKSGKAILPLSFELSYDSLRRRCRMVWRRGNFFGVAFEYENAACPSDPELKDADLAESGGLLLFNGPPQLVRPADHETVAQFASEMASRSGDDRSDLRFSMAVAIALAMPVLISIGGYVALWGFLKGNG